MKTIKFRAWNKEENRILQGEPNFVNQHFYENENSKFPNLGTDFRVLEIMQFTGLKDKHGKDIYEGDIVRILYTDWASCSGCHTSPDEHMEDIAHNAIVEWSYNGFYLTRKPDGYAEPINPGRHGFIKIIGNIYSNPELISNQ